MNPPALAAVESNVCKHSSPVTHKAMPEDQTNLPPDSSPHPRRSGQNTRDVIVNIQTEHERDSGWSYEVAFEHADGMREYHTVTLAWCDHDYWSGGRIAPSRVLQTVLEYALAQMKAGAAPLPTKFDAARLRRLFPNLDSEVRFGSAAA